MAQKKRGKSRKGFPRWLKRQFGKEIKPVWMGIVAHVLALGIALVLFALPHHVIPRAESSVGMVSTRGGAVQAMMAGTPEPEPVEPQEEITEDEPEASTEIQPEAEPAATEAPQPDVPAPEPTLEPDAFGSFRNKYADKFTESGVKRVDNNYRSPNVNVTLSSNYVQAMAARAHVADIYIADITCFQTAFGKDTYGRGYTEWITKVAQRTQSVVTINGDYYGSRDTGIVIRNGMLYRNNKNREDVAVLYWDGHMEMIAPDAFDAENEIMRGAYQCWCFGPSLLDENGRALEKFNCSARLARKNPRTALGYYEPGHYCFVTVDGRSDDSRGASMEQLAALMEYLGCKQAYNLDGGQTSLMCAGGKMVNQAADGGRSSSDYILIVDSVSG